MTGADMPPMVSRLTRYDEAHLVHYIRLLDAADEGADWREAAIEILGLDPADEDARAIYERHLSRARWMTEIGYAWLLGPPAAS
jgi:hypothetical protein